MITIAACNKCGKKMNVARNGIVAHVGKSYFNGDAYDCPTCDTSVFVTDTQGFSNPEPIDLIISQKENMLLQQSKFKMINQKAMLEEVPAQVTIAGELNGETVITIAFSMNGELFVTTSTLEKLFGSEQTLLIKQNLSKQITKESQMCKECREHNPEKVKKAYFDPRDLGSKGPVTCPSCGGQNSEFEANCTECGKPIPHPLTLPTGIPTPTDTPVKGSQMIESLVTLADQLDSKGLTEEANLVDGLLVEAKKKKEKKEKKEDKKDDDKKDDKKKGKGFPFWLGKKKKAEVITSLVAIANALDAKGLTVEANEVDGIVNEVKATPEIEASETEVVEAVKQ